MRVFFRLAARVKYALFLLSNLMLALLGLLPFSSPFDKQRSLYIDDMRGRRF
jgi:hypothetical protein